MRLDKFLSNSLTLSRAEIPQILKQNRVSVNGAVIKKKDYKSIAYAYIYSLK